MNEQPSRLAMYEDLLRRTASGVRNAQLYAPDHPLVARNMAGLIAVLGTLHQQQGSIAVGIVGNDMVVADTPMHKLSSTMSELIKKLKDNKVEDAIGQAVALAKYPNVSVKLSASPGISREPYPFRDVAGHLKRVFDAYGPQRSYWGTDLTNSYAKASYRQRISQFTEELNFLSESDKDWVMGRAIAQRLKWM